MARQAQLFNTLKPLVKKLDPDYKLTTVTYIFKVSQLTRWIPFDQKGGTIWLPGRDWTFVYTDGCDGVAEWIAEHREHILEYWQKPVTLKDKNYVRPATLTRRGNLAGSRVDTLTRHQQQYQIYLDRKKLGHLQRDIAKDLGVTSAHIYNLKKKFAKTVDTA